MYCLYHYRISLSTMGVYLNMYFKHTKIGDVKYLLLTNNKNVYVNYLILMYNLIVIIEFR